MNKLTFRLAEFSQRRAWLILIATALVTVVLGYFALRIEIDSNMDNLIPQDAKVNQLFEKYGGGSSDTDFLVIAAQAPDLFSVEKLSALDAAYQEISRLPSVTAGITPFSIITFGAKDGRLVLAPMVDNRAAPATQEEAEAFKSRISSDPIARGLVVSKDGTALCAFFSVTVSDNYQPLLAATEKILQPLRSKIDLKIAGALPYTQAIVGHLTGDLPIFLLVALLVIIVSYYFGFRTLRGVVLPVLVVILGTLWTIGAMKILGMKITVMQSVTPPLVLVLGSAYSIHILNQYYRESRVVGEDKRWIADSVAHIYTTIILAAATTVFGFASFLTASLTQLREFGVATSIGIFFCAILALFFLPAALSLLPAPTSTQRERVLDGFITHHMGRLADMIMRRRFFVLAGAVLIAIVFVMTLGGIRYETDFTKYFKNKEQAVTDNQFLIDKMGGFVSINYSLTAPNDEPGYFQKPEVLRQVSAFEETVAEDPDIPYVSSFSQYLKAMNQALTGKSEIPEARPLILLLSRYFSALSGTPMGKNLTDNLMNRDFSRYTVSLRVYDNTHMNMAFEESLRKTMTRIDAAARQTLPAEVKKEYWGRTISLLYIADVLTQNQIWSIITSALLVFLISALVFRSAKLGALVLAPLASGIMATFVVMWIFSIPLDVVTITFASIAIGIGVDNALHLTIQYRRQRTIFPTDAERTIEHTMKVGGRPMLLTTLSIAAALMLFIFSGFRPILYFGILISVSLAMTTAGALILLPVLLYFDAKAQVKKAGAVEPAAAAK